MLICSAFFLKSEHCGCMLKDILLCAANTPADTAATVSFLHQVCQMTNTTVK